MLSKFKTNNNICLLGSYLLKCPIYICRYIHYVIDQDSYIASMKDMPAYLQALKEPQWINCDVRQFPMEVLGKFGVIMADPPWEIH